MPNEALLKIALETAVPVWMWGMIEKGGPDETDYERTKESVERLGAQGDILMFGGGKKGVVADLFNGLAHGIAVLSFCPGGVKTFGMRFVAGVCCKCAQPLAGPLYANVRPELVIEGNQLAHKACEPDWAPLDDWSEETVSPQTIQQSIEAVRRPEQLSFLEGLEDEESDV